MFSHDSWIDFDDLWNALMCLVSVALRGTPAKIWFHIKFEVCRARVY